MDELEDILKRIDDLERRLTALEPPPPPDEYIILGPLAHWRMVRNPKTGNYQIAETLWESSLMRD